MQLSPDIERLLERFDEPLRDGTASPPDAPRPPFAAPDRRLPQPQDAPGAPALIPVTAPVAEESANVPLKTLIPALVGIVLVPAAILLVQGWQGMLTAPTGDAVTKELSMAGPAASSVSVAKQNRSPLNVALSAPDRIEAEAGETIAFPVAVDATAPLPARSIIAISALPQGASFSQGRPYGDTGWSLRPDEIGGLRLRPPMQSDTSDIRLELVAGDGTVLAHAVTQLSIAPAPAQVATADEIATADEPESAPVEANAPAGMTGSVAAVPPAPPRRPDVKINPVKTVTIQPPRETKPYDGAYALGAPADEPGEWMETKTAVDMHARAEQKSETVKVAQGGLKVRVTGRDENWIQVHDPASATTGWIYNRFLKPADAPTQ